MRLLLVPILLLFIFTQGQCQIMATVNMKRDNSNNSIGILTLKQDGPNSPVMISGTLTGLSPNKSKGFHVHQVGVSFDFPNCTAALGHFNPYNTVHGAPENDITRRHVGDLGNVTTDANGKVTISISDSIIDFYNQTRNIANRSLVIHEMFDDGGTGSGQSNITGNAGPRVACGIIELTSASSNPKLFLSIFLDCLCFLWIFKSL